MPKGKKGGRGDDTRGLKAKGQKAEAAAAKAARAAAAKKAEEDQEWAVGANSRSQKKKAEEARKRAEKEAARAAIKAAEAKDAEELATMKKALRGTEKKLAAKGAAHEKRGEEIAFERSSAIEGSGLDGALAALDEVRGGAGGGKGVERHPERRAKSAYKAFVESEMPGLKEEFPGLRERQYKQKLQKMWKRSPDNPMNQEHVAYNAKAGDSKGGQS